MKSKVSVTDILAQLSTVVGIEASINMLEHTCQ